MVKHIRATHGRRFPRIRRIGQRILAGALVAFVAACGSARQREGAASSAAAGAAGTGAYRIDSLVTLRGCVVCAHEVRAFTPENDTTEYWIVDRTGALEREYDRVTGGRMNGHPARIVAKMRYKGASDEGFAAQYAGLFEVEELLSVEKAGE